MKKSIKTSILIAGTLVAIIILLSTQFGYGQSRSISLRMQNVTLEQVILTLKEQTDIVFIFNHEKVQQITNVSVDIQNGTVEEVLDQALEGKDLTYERVGDKIVIATKGEAKSANGSGLKQTVRGKTLDRDSQLPLPYVTVAVLGTQPLLGAVSDIDGNFVIENVPVGRI
ncbi:STN and carboxypeptidase regulatory-like domain-containing protein [Reichenbachiella ulvae]|uniref:Secretin and TonB N-terminal domain-containing protein n=1 Tax=Reichenbachiella ulvae TaxID=2980104 RepID=A0ABT3CN12_9BACT|nr:STN and carboxypeptidase regulatory-like domain-containing protein [Reichenbachiella ulvae]MCV9385075.1 secretin and TonB N-terminal domain-containing protein [Reichenbachiella ulvae]